MMTIIIKSIISLIFLYVFYCLLLRNIKTFKFNRFYLLFTLIFSITIPFVNLKIGLNLTINQGIQDLSNSTNGFFIQGNIIDDQTYKSFTIINMVSFLYLIVSLIFLVRLIWNLNRLIKTIKNSEKADDSQLNIVLVTDKTLPYSFFRYIIVNKYEYENGMINNELLIHEQTHCEQFHSIDILLYEFIKVLLWFNPMIWIFKKEIQLNHEYLADNEVILENDRETYQNIILNFVFRNNSTYLASNSNYSLTKKRLIMMKKNNSLSKMIFRKIAAFLTFLVLAISLTLAQNKQEIRPDNTVSGEWWYPFVKKHGFNIDRNKFNTLIIADKIIDSSYENIKIAFNQGDSAVFIVEAPKAIINKNMKSYIFFNGKDFKYYKNGDTETGEFKKIEIKK